MMLFPLSERSNSLYVTQLRGDFALSVSIPIYQKVVNESFKFPANYPGNNI